LNWIVPSEVVGCKGAVGRPSQCLVTLVLCIGKSVTVFDMAVFLILEKGTVSPWATFLSRKILTTSYLPCRTLSGVVRTPFFDLFSGSDCCEPDLLVEAAEEEDDDL
jgi:hypothetical protein